MSNPNLRVNSPSADSRRVRELDRITGTAAPKTVSIPLAEIVPLLLDAVHNNRAWLKDFSDDLVQIDSDLYDVLLAYKDLTKRAAA